MTTLDTDRNFEITAKGEINGDSVTVTVDRGYVTIERSGLEMVCMDHAAFDFAAAELARYRRLAGLIDHEEG